jgi:hypothetical protein
LDLRPGAGDGHAASDDYLTEIPQLYVLLGTIEMSEQPLPTSLMTIRVTAMSPVRALLARLAQFQAIGAKYVVALRHEAATLYSLRECPCTDEGATASGAALGVPAIGD